MLQLFSPVGFQFFKNKHEHKIPQKYEKDNFFLNKYLNDAKLYSNKNIKHYYDKNIEENFDYFFNYIWKENDLVNILRNEIRIEVFLGENDTIADTFKAKYFFRNYSTVYYFKDKGHLL